MHATVCTNMWSVCAHNVAVVLSFFILAFPKVYGL